MKKLDAGQVALITGVFFGLLHLAWATAVALGFAQALLDWIYGLHFLNNPFTVGAFEVTRAVILVIVTFVCGYVLGWVFTWIWNWLIKQK